MCINDTSKSGEREDEVEGISVGITMVTSPKEALLDPGKFTPY